MSTHPDKTDIKILSELQKDGSVTNLALSEKVGISAPPCLRRVRALEKSGYIRGYHAEIAAEKMGFGITAFAMVSMTNHSEADILHVAKLIENWPQVRESHLMTGDTDFLLKIVAEDWEDFQKTIATHLGALGNIAQVKLMPALRRTKYAPGIPLEALSKPAVV